MGSVAIYGLCLQVLIPSRVVTKPVIGVFDLASNLSEGIRNTTTVFDNPARDRVRMVSDEYI